MGLFSKKRQQQQAELAQISFEGEQPVLTTTFKLEYEDILDGLKVAAVNNPNQSRARWGSAVFTVFVVMALPFMFQKSILVGAVALAMAAYLVFNALYGEKISMKAKAKESAAEAKEVELSIYKTGVKIHDGTRNYNISYRLIKMYETETAFLALLGKAMMLSFPKRCFGDDLPVIREIFVMNLGSGKRFLQVDEKGKVKTKKL